MVDLERHLLQLIAPTRVGEELLPGVRLVRFSAELGWRLTVALDDVEVDVEIARLDPGRRHAAATERLGIAYRLDRSGAGLDGERMRGLCEAIARRIAPQEAAVLDALTGEASAVAGHGARIREVAVSRILDPMGTPAERFYGLSPYSGCLIGCRFCYAQSRLREVRRLTLVDDVPWGSYVDVRVDAPALLARELAELPSLPIKFCPIVSDPYHAVERRYRLTRRCLEVLRDASPRTVLLLTRSAAILEDVELLGSVAGLHAGVSLPTVDDAVREHFEPRGASITERISVLRSLRASGVQTFAIVQPILPGSIEALADVLGETVTSVRIDVLRGVEGATAEFADPRYAESVSEGWQRERARLLDAALRARGVTPWASELPPLSG